MYIVYTLFVHVECRIHIGICQRHIPHYYLLNTKYSVLYAEVLKHNLFMYTIYIVCTCTHVQKCSSMVMSNNSHRHSPTKSQVYVQRCIQNLMNSLYGWFRIG